MSQLTYSVLMAAAFIGAHGQMIRVLPGRNNSGAEIAYGRAVAFDGGAGTTDLAVKPPSAANSVIRGVVLYDASHEPQTTGVADDAMLSVLEQGDVFMLSETAATPADPVYVRFNATGATGTTPAVGQVRKNADGAAEVNTLTPTAANAQLYGVGFNINGRSFQFSYLSDGTGTAQEICDGLRAAMAADAAFTALVVGSGTTTLILTSQQAGVAQNVTTNGTGVIAIVATTPAAPTAVLMPSWKFRSTAVAGAGIWVEVNP